VTCRACTLADQKPLTGFYMGGCPDCKARHLAQSPVFHGCVVAGKKTPEYEKALADAFGEDQATQDHYHLQVKEWRKRIKKAMNDD
jgi:hypothetical protein